MLRVYAQLAAASAPLIEAPSFWRRRCDRPPLSRPHNLHYVGMPAARGCAPRGGRFAPSLIASIAPDNTAKL
jgi:hypothetical protein